MAWCEAAKAEGLHPDGYGGRSGVPATDDHNLRNLTKMTWSG
jgi:hypothetical protein